MFKMTFVIFFFNNNIKAISSDIKLISSTGFSIALQAGAANAIMVQVAGVILTCH